MRAMPHAPTSVPSSTFVGVFRVLTEAWRHVLSQARYPSPRDIADRTRLCSKTTTRLSYIQAWRTAARLLSFFAVGGAVRIVQSSLPRYGNPHSPSLLV